MFTHVHTHTHSMKITLEEIERERDSYRYKLSERNREVERLAEQVHSLLQRILSPSEFAIHSTYNTIFYTHASTRTHAHTHTIVGIL